MEWMHLKMQLPSVMIVSSIMIVSGCVCAVIIIVHEMPMIDTTLLWSR